MNQTWENGQKKKQKKNTAWFWSILAQIWSQNFFFMCLISTNIDVNIVASYHCMQFREKLMNQSWKNGRKNLVSGPLLGTKIFFHGFNFY